MKIYKVKIDPEAIIDLQEISSWYNDTHSKTSKRFEETTIKQIDSLSKNPQIYSIRYKDIRCMLVKRFPYMVHFYINEIKGDVEVLAIISTQRNPKVWKEKTGKHI